MRFLVDGPSLIRRTVELADECEMMADLGCGSGWLAMELARRAPGGFVKAVDRELTRIHWGQSYYDEVLSKKRVGEVEFICQDIVTYELAPHSYDLIVCNFFLSCLEEPGTMLRRIHEALRPGGYLVYYDGCDPSKTNLENIARLRHRFRYGGAGMNDLWSQYRKMEASYQSDAIRGHRPKGAPPETHLYHRILETFELVFETKTRAFLDTLVDKILPRRLPLLLPTWKLIDEICMLTGYLEGSARYLIARRR